MTFPRAKPAGWTDAVDNITGAELSQIDANLSAAIDGAAGGSYAPSSALQIAGSGLELTNCVNHNVTGSYSLLHQSARISYRVDRATVDPNAASSYRIDTSKDIYISTGPGTTTATSVVLNVSTAGYQIPSDGARIFFRKHVNTPGPQTDTTTMTFYSESASSPSLGSIAGLSLLGGSNSYVWVKFLFDSMAGRWVVEDAEQRFQV